MELANENVQAPPNAGFSHPRSDFRATHGVLERSLDNAQDITPNNDFVLSAYDARVGY